MFKINWWIHSSSSSRYSEFVEKKTGVAVRIGLSLSGLQPMLASAMELVVSSTSWERAQEGYFLGTL